MLNIERELKLLAEYKIDCVVFGGIAARAHGSSHKTNELDVCNARDSENLDQLAAARNSKLSWSIRQLLNFGQKTMIRIELYANLVDCTHSA